MSIPTKQGLLPLKRDARDFNYTKTFGAVSLPEEDFMVGKPLGIKDQGDSDMCVAFALSAVSELQEGVELSPEWFFMRAKQETGNWQSWGLDLRTACKLAVDVGSLTQDKAEYSLKNKGRTFLANPNNWQHTKYGNSFELDMYARKHRKASYFRVDSRGYSDLFDAMRAVLWNERASKKGGLSGLLWRSSWNDIKSGVVPEIKDVGQFGHAIAFVGQKRINNQWYLVAQTSNGTEMGDNGYYYFPREVINKELKFGLFTFKDIEPEQAKQLCWDWKIKVLHFLKQIINK